MLEKLCDDDKVLGNISYFESAVYLAGACSLGYFFGWELNNYFTGINPNHIEYIVSCGLVNLYPFVLKGIVDLNDELKSDELITKQDNKF